MISGHFSRGYKSIKGLPKPDFIAALLAAEKNAFEGIFQIRERYKAEESTWRVLSAADEGDAEALSMLAKGISAGPFTGG